MLNKEIFIRVVSVSPLFKVLMCRVKTDSA